jgi:succinate dehydrogenase hydrophobic anchor subunit
MWTVAFLYVFVYLGYHTVSGIQHIIQDYLPSIFHIDFFSTPRILAFFTSVFLMVYLVI